MSVHRSDEPIELISKKVKEAGMECNIPIDFTTGELVACRYNYTKNRAEIIQKFIRVEEMKRAPRYRITII